MTDNLQYTDCMFLIANSQENRQYYGNTIVITKSKNVGLTINVKKTEIMIIAISSLIPTCELNIGHHQVGKFKNLWILIIEDRKFDKDYIP